MSQGKTLDSCIFGDGPGGIATAARLIERGATVTILDRPLRPYPWVGETFSGEIRAPLATLGMWTAFCAAGHVHGHEVRSTWNAEKFRREGFDSAGRTPAAAGRRFGRANNSSPECGQERPRRTRFRCKWLRRESQNSAFRIKRNVSFIFLAPSQEREGWRALFAFKHHKLGESSQLCIQRSLPARSVPASQSVRAADVLKQG